MRTRAQIKNLRHSSLYHHSKNKHIRFGLSLYNINRVMGPSINYVRIKGGWGGQHQCIQMRTRGEGGSDHDQNTHFVRRFIENATLPEPFKERL